MNDKYYNLILFFSCTSVPHHVIASDEKCMSDCWAYNKSSEKCEPKKHVENCYILKCDWDAMRLEFDSRLMGVEDGDETLFNSQG